MALLTVVCDPRATQVELDELLAVEQAPPHHRVTHLGAGQAQDLRHIKRHAQKSMDARGCDLGNTHQRGTNNVCVRVSAHAHVCLFVCARI